MRIIGGKYGGRVFHPPKGLPVRPTTDQSKEALFNILNHTLDFEGLRVLDLFSGTGNIGVEFLSRGSQVSFVDQNRKCILWIKKWMVDLNEQNTQIYQSPVEKFVRKNNETYDLIFLDPPYAWTGYDALIDQVFQRGLLEQTGTLILEHNIKSPVSHITNYQLTRKYGGSGFSFYKLDESDSNK